MGPAWRLNEDKTLRFFAEIVLVLSTRSQTGHRTFIEGVFREYCTRCSGNRAILRIHVRERDLS